MGGRKKSDSGASRAKRGASERSRPDEHFPVLFSTEVVPLPGLVIPLHLTDEFAVRAVDRALSGGGELLVLPEMETRSSIPDRTLIGRVGALCRVVQAVRLAGRELRASLHCVERARISAIASGNTGVKAVRIGVAKVVMLSASQESRLSAVKQQLAALARYEQVSDEHLRSIHEIFDPGMLADTVAALLSIDWDTARVALEELDADERLRKVSLHLSSMIDSLAIKERVSEGAQRHVGKEQHQELLREQLKIIQAELGEEDEFETELGDLHLQLEQAKMPSNVRTEAMRQLRRLRQFHPETSEAALLRTYIDWLIDLPWSKRTKDRLDLGRARAILDEEHFGLDSVKQRILDYLAVRVLKPGARGPVLLFVGPPGVGKTSLGKAIARALGRKFVRIAIGGLRDEAELRGHRRTYVGALPGRLIQALKTAGTKNPILMLDELDKVGSDFRGDPASVLLEILDPEQNREFEDHYLNVPFDLSEVMFIGTANMTDTIPPALLDRMEMLELGSYGADEKRSIAAAHLIPRAKDEAGIKRYRTEITDEAVERLIYEYTREAGVRELGRVLEGLFRKVARGIAEGGKVPREISAADLERYLGIPKYSAQVARTSDEVGVVTGLAWTPAGGEILTVEVSVTIGKGQLSLTGNMGEVMRESAMAALTFVQSAAVDIGIDPGFYEHSHVHVHIPQGAIPKDGPSAGLAVAVGLISVLTRRPVSRKVAITGEITLRGNVIGVGGVREKALAALRAGINAVVIPRENEREVHDLFRGMQENLTFVPVDRALAAAEHLLLPSFGVEVAASKSVEAHPQGEQTGVPHRQSRRIEP